MSQNINTKDELNTFVIPIMINKCYWETLDASDSVEAL